MNAQLWHRADARRVSGATTSWPADGLDCAGRKDDDRVNLDFFVADASMLDTHCSLCNARGRHQQAGGRLDSWSSVAQSAHDSVLTLDNSSPTSPALQQLILGFILYP